MKDYLFKHMNDQTSFSISMLLFRAAMGLAFMFHGMPKIQNMFGWMGDSQIPGFLQAMAALSEFGGGIFLALGFLTPLASLALMVTMTGALALVHLPMGHPFVAMEGPSSELAIIYLSGAFLIFTASPGKFSVDYWLWMKKTHSPHAESTG